jgi:hypothetical protein
MPSWQRDMVMMAVRVRTPVSTRPIIGSGTAGGNAAFPPLRDTFRHRSTTQTVPGKFQD